MSLTTQAVGPCDQPYPCNGATGHPIRYSSGKILLEHVDLDVGIPGLRHTRTFQSRNYTLADWDSPHGWNWAATDWPYLVRRVYQPTPEITMESITLKQGLNPLWFDKVGDNFVCRYTGVDRNFLEHIPAEGIYRYTHISEQSVNQIEFQDFEQPASCWGLMKKEIDANGYVINAINYGDKTITELQSIRDSVTWNLKYDFISSGALSGKVNSSWIEKIASGNTTYIRRVRYVYYTETNAEGRLGDLKAAIQQQPVPDTSPVQWQDVSVNYYRYQIDGAHLLKYVVKPATYSLLKQAGQDVLTMTSTVGGQDLVPLYADNYFEYDEVNRVIKEIANTGDKSTGLNGLTYSRVRNSNVKHNNKTVKNETDFNTWYWKITEAGQSGYSKIVYTNKIGQPLATIKQALDRPQNKWIKAVRYDGNGRIVISARPSAVIGIDENYLDLIGYRDDGSFSLLKVNEGLLGRTTYYTSTTATSSTPGGVSGYVYQTFIQQGYQGAWIPQKTYTYLSSDDGANPIYVLASETSFKDGTDTPLSRITKAYQYNWYAPVFDQPARIKQKATIFPIIPISDGGDGIAKQSKEYFDINGNQIWLSDERGVITKRTYDLSRSIVLQEIQDYGSPDLPDGWVLMPGTHLNETTDFQYDDQSRLTRTLGPEHEAILAGAAVTLRRMNTICYVTPPLSAQALNQPPAYDQVRSATGFYNSINVEIINPVSIELKDLNGRIWHQIVSRRTTGTGSLAPSDSFTRSDWSRWIATFYNERGLKISERIYFDIPVSSTGLQGVSQDIGNIGLNYDESQWGYSSDTALFIRQFSPEGTIRRVTYDDLERPISVYIGTQDVPTGSGQTWEDWEPGALGTNLVEVTRNEYDLGLVGADSNLTSVVKFVNQSEVRETKYFYDYRNRKIAEDGEVDFYVEYAYDNLNRITEVRRRNMSSVGNIVALTKNAYNARNWLFQTLRYSVDPSDGSLGNYLVGTISYDAVGNVLTSIEPGAGLSVVWMQYDNLTRTTSVKSGFYNTASSPSDAVIVESSETIYDAAGNAVGTVIQKLDTNSSLALSTFRSSYAWSWFDPLGREVANANFGANAVPPVRPDIPPASSDSQLVANLVYSDSAEISLATDTAGVQTRYSYDDKGRQSEVIQNYVSPGNVGSPDSGCNRTSRKTFTADDQVKTLQVIFPNSSQNQLTTFIYGTDLDTSDIASNKYLSRKVFADSTEVILSYNRQGQVIKKEESNETIHTYDFDSLGRLIHDRVPHIGTNVFDSVLRLSYTYEVRGMLSSMISATSAEGDATSTLNEVRRIYDSFGFLQTEFQEHVGKAVTKSNWSRNVSYARNTGSGNSNKLIDIYYPSGQKFTLEYGNSNSIDRALDRVTGVLETSGVSQLERVTYGYLGRDFTVKVNYGGGLAQLDLWGGTVGNYSGLDIFDRVIDYPWKTSSGTLAHLTYGYGRKGNRLYRQDLKAQEFSANMDELYSYDGLDQITYLNRGRLNSTHNGLLPGTHTFDDQINFDTIGNWTFYFQGGPVHPTVSQQREHNLTNEISNIDTNLGDQWSQLTYNENGESVRIPKPNDLTEPYRVDYDPWGKVGIVYQFDGMGNKLRVLRHHYDALGRRVRSWDYNALSKFEGLHDFYYDDQWRRIEEYLGIPDGNSEPVTKLDKQYLWDYALNGYSDALILRKTFDASGVLTTTLYALQDSHFNTVAVMDTAGVVRERFSYSAFGIPQFWNSDFSSATASNCGFNVLYSGYLLEPKTGLYHVRNRDYHAPLGRWVTRDPIAENGGPNLYSFVKNNPGNLSDSLGLIDYNFDKDKCTLKVTVTWSLKFVNQPGFPKWTSSARSKWKKDAEKTVEDYFNNLPFMCYPASSTCCTCTGGVKIEFNLRFNGFVEFWKKDFLVTVTPDPNHRSKTGSDYGEYDSGDNTPQDKGASQMQTPILHETGHQLGLDHPGGPTNDDASYAADKESLMGYGAMLRLSDFDKAFCSHIASGDAGCDPWSGA